MIRRAAMLTALVALALAILAVAGCAAFDRPEYQMQRTAVHIQVSEVPFGMTVGADGRVHFIPSGTIPAGKYFYDAQALDSNGEKATFSEGAYVVTQDITKT